MTVDIGGSAVVAHDAATVGLALDARERAIRDHLRRGARPSVSRDYLTRLVRRFPLTRERKAFVVEQACLQRAGPALAQAGRARHHAARPFETAVFLMHLLFPCRMSHSTHDPGVGALPVDGGPVDAVQAAVGAIGVTTAVGAREQMTLRVELHHEAIAVIERTDLAGAAVVAGNEARFLDLADPGGNAAEVAHEVVFFPQGSLDAPRQRRGRRRCFGGRCGRCGIGGRCGRHDRGLRSRRGSPQTRTGATGERRSECRKRRERKCTASTAHRWERKHGMDSSGR